MTAKVDLVVDLPCSAKNASARCFRSRRMNAEISGGVNSASPDNQTASASPPIEGEMAGLHDVVAPPFHDTSSRRCAARRSGAGAAPRDADEDRPLSPTGRPRAGPSPLRSRITSGLPSPAKATSEFVVPRSMPTTLPCLMSSARVLSGERVVDSCAPGTDRAAPRRVLAAAGVPLRRQLRRCASC